MCNNYILGEYFGRMNLCSVKLGACGSNKSQQRHVWASQNVHFLDHCVWYPWICEILGFFLKGIFLNV